MPGKLLTRLIKTRPCGARFTLCLPGRPKVNTGGACGAWLPGRELSRISASDDRIEGTGLLLQGGQLPARHDRDVIVPEPARLCGQHLTSSCNGWCRTPRPVVKIAEAPS